MIAINNTQQQNCKKTLTRAALGERRRPLTYIRSPDAEFWDSSTSKIYLGLSCP